MNGTTQAQVSMVILESVYQAAQARRRVHAYLQDSRTICKAMTASLLNEGADHLERACSDAFEAAERVLAAARARRAFVDALAEQGSI